MMIYWLLCNVFLMVFNSVCFGTSVIGYIYNIFSREFVLDNLCSCGWQEPLGIIISICMGFLYI
jgi:hypothetical protein